MEAVQLLMYDNQAVRPRHAVQAAAPCSMPHREGCASANMNSQSQPQAIKGDDPIRLTTVTVATPNA